jgi:multiple sugar transport system substrate-binding protein
MSHRTEGARALSRRLAKTTAAIAAVAVISATGVGTASVANASTVNITWETMWSGPVLVLLAHMVKAFEATHPGVTVTQVNIASATGEATLQSQIAAGDPPDVFTDWNPVLGEYAANGLIQPFNPYLTGAYAGFEKWEYPIALDGGLYHGNLYGVPMSENSWALYYNKSLLKAAGITRPPTTLAQLHSDSAKTWVITGGKLQQIGFYPAGGFQYFASFFGAVNCFNKAGKYDFENCPGAKAEANFLAQYDNYPYAQFDSVEAAYNQVAGGDDDVFVAGKQAFNMDGPWEGAQNIPDANPKMEGNFGVVAFPNILGGPSTFGQGNYNIIPAGAHNAKQAFQLIAWLAGYNNVKFTSQVDPQGGWMPASPEVAAAPAYQAWIKANPWLSVFLQEMSSPYSVTPALTPAESQFQEAEAVATNGILLKTMTPAAALKYIDTQANG